MKFLKKYIFILFLVLFLFSGGYIFDIYLAEYRIEKDFEVEKGESLYSVLEKTNINVDIYKKIYFKITSKEKLKVEAGVYNIHGRYTFFQLMKKLKKGRDEMVVVTIPEGYTMNKIAEKLEEKGVIKRKDFEEALYLYDSSNFYYPIYNHKFEGYFFPDTYYFSKNEDAEDIINKFLNRFLEKYPPQEYEDKEAFYKKLILASIIEKEAGAEEEMELISSVFMNRMKKGMKLQSCATVAYLFDFEKSHISYNDLKIESEYNTYLNKGLPPAPISNPGKKAMEASYKPAISDYYYFVLQKNGRHHFSKTYKDHIKVQNK
jgi:UPF0755 protein